MAIHANYDDGAEKYKDVLVKLDRIWGSKSENWNAWVNVFRKKDKHILRTFSVTAPYVEGQNPYEVLYKALGESPYLKDVCHDIEEQPKSVVKRTLREVKM